MKIAVVILNWNTKDYLRMFLPPLLDSVAMFNGGVSSLETSIAGNGSHQADGQPDRAEVIVADSASTDGSMEMMAKEFPSVRRIPLDKSSGIRENCPLHSLRPVHSAQLGHRGHAGLAAAARRMDERASGMRCLRPEAAQLVRARYV